MSAKAYVLLNVRENMLGEVARVLKMMPGVIAAEVLEGPPDLVMILEAPERRRLAELTVQALASVENTAEVSYLLPAQKPVARKKKQKMEVIPAGGNN